MLRVGVVGVFFAGPPPVGIEFFLPQNSFSLYLAKT